MRKRPANVIDLFEATTESRMPAAQFDVSELPLRDNTREALQILRAANEQFRVSAWPEPFNATTHDLRLGDARDLSFIPNGSVHLVVT